MPRGTFRRIKRSYIKKRSFATHRIQFRVNIHEFKSQNPSFASSENQWTIEVSCFVLVFGLKSGPLVVYNNRFHFISFRSSYVQNLSSFESVNRMAKYYLKIKIVKKKLAKKCPFDCGNGILVSENLIKAQVNDFD